MYQPAPGYGAPPPIAGGYQQNPNPYGQPPVPYPTGPPPGVPQYGGYGSPPHHHHHGHYGHHGAAPQNPILALFQAVDRDRSGRIKPVELQQALRQGGLEFNPDTAHRMVNMFDRSGDGQLDVNEFQQLHAWIMTMAMAFQQVDKDRSGLLDGREVRSTLAVSQFQLQEQTFQALMRKMDREKRGALSFSGYIDMCIFLGHCRNTFGFYDQARTGQVTFNFDNFLLAALSLRV